MEIGVKIKEIRKSLGLTQQQFADKILVNQSTVSNIEKGTDQEPSFRIIYNIVNVLRVNPYYLLCDDNVMFYFGGEFSNKAKLNNIIGYAKRILTEGERISV